MILKKNSSSSFIIYLFFFFPSFSPLFLSYHFLVLSSKSTMLLSPALFLFEFLNSEKFKVKLKKQIEIGSELASG